MFYVLYLANRCDFNKLKQTVIDTITNGKGIKDDVDSLSIYCDYFSLSLKNGGTQVQFRSEDYGMNFKYQFWFEIYSETPNWMEEMLSFIGKIMKMFEGDCVLESNGDTPIVMRKEKDKTVIVDDKRLKGLQKFPFDKLNLEYKEGDLIQV